MVKSVLFTNKPKDKSKENDKEKEKELLSKKRQEPDTPHKDVDMVKLKKKINDIMSSICNPNSNKENNDIDYLYQSMHKKYLLNEFTSNCLNYINKIIVNAKKNHLKKYQGMFELNKLFISIIKELLMNEFELILLSLYLESIDISLYSDIFSFQESIIYLCYFIKKLTLTPDKLSPINSFLIRKYQGFEDRFNKWFHANSSVFNSKLYFSYVEINQRFKEYNISYSIYCKNNYIDYNLIIDRILTMSIPYNETKNENSFNDKKENSSDLLLANNNHININSINPFNENSNNISDLLYPNNNYNNINNIYNSSYIRAFPATVYINTNNNQDINMGCLYNGNSILFNQINKTSNKTEQIPPQFINKEFISMKQTELKNKNNINFKVTNINNINCLDNNNMPNSNDINPKIQYNNKKIFITEEPKKTEDSLLQDEPKKNNINDNDNDNCNIKPQKVISEKVNNKKLSLTPNNLLYSLDNENMNNFVQNNHNDNFNLAENMYKQIKNIKNYNDINNNNNNILIKNNEAVNSNPNQLVGFNHSQQINDYNALKYNTNLGVNDFNPPSQMSFLSSKNPYFADINNLYQNSLHCIDQEENYKQLINQSNENFFKSCLSVGSSKNFYQNINNMNYANNNNIEEPGNINNLNYPPVNQMIIGNPVLLNIQNGLNNVNFGKSNITQEKKVEGNVDKNNDDN